MGSELCFCFLETTDVGATQGKTELHTGVKSVSQLVLQMWGRSFSLLCANDYVVCSYDILWNHRFFHFSDKFNSGCTLNIQELVSIHQRLSPKSVSMYLQFLLNLV